MSLLHFYPFPFVTPELKEYFSDLLYRVEMAGHTGYVYVLFEHKSYSDGWISLQLLEYMLQCWKLKREQKRKLPVIIPIVVYHGEEKWKGGKLSELLEYKDERLVRYIPDFRYVLQDLSQCREQELMGVGSLKAMLHLLKDVIRVKRSLKNFSTPKKMKGSHSDLDFHGKIRDNSIFYN